MPHDEQMVPITSNEIIGPNRFGPSLWQGLHYITLGYPNKPTKEQKQKYKSLFTLLKDTLPCSICANHYAEKLKTMPITEEVLETRENLVKWLIDIHNIVNEQKGKEIIEYEVAREMIDTDIECEPNIRIVKQSSQSQSQSQSQSSQSQSQSPQSKQTQSSKSNDTCDIKLFYGLIGILFTLILIAVVYKKN